MKFFIIDFLIIFYEYTFILLIFNILFKAQKLSKIKIFDFFPCFLLSLRDFLLYFYKFSLFIENYMLMRVNNKK